MPRDFPNEDDTSPSRQYKRDENQPAARPAPSADPPSKPKQKKHQEIGDFFVPSK